MALPTITEYIEALMFAPDIFNKYNTLIPFRNSENDIVFSSGNFAVVFKMQCKKTGKTYALKVFHRNQEGRIESYKYINQHINNSGSEYLVHYDFCLDEIEVNGELFSALVMEWIEGETLGVYLKRLVKREEKDAIFALAYNFDRMALWLLDQSFAHGDLKPENIIIDKNGILRLIDYDGLYTPEMKGQKARENGSPGFRHPAKKVENFNSEIDLFSIDIISFCLHALAIMPELGIDANFDDILLFNENELINPVQLYSRIPDRIYNTTETKFRFILLTLLIEHPSEMNSRLKTILKTVIEEPVTIKDSPNSKGRVNSKIHLGNGVLKVIENPTSPEPTELRFKETRVMNQNLVAAKRDQAWILIDSNGCIYDKYNYSHDYETRLVQKHFEFFMKILNFYSQKVLSLESLNRKELLKENKFEKEKDALIRKNKKNEELLKTYKLQIENCKNKIESLQVKMKMSIEKENVLTREKNELLRNIDNDKRMLTGHRKTIKDLENEIKILEENLNTEKTNYLTKFNEMRGYIEQLKNLKWYHRIFNSRNVDRNF